jgi:transposase
MNEQSKFSPEVRERAVRMVREHRGKYSSQWSAVQSIAGKIGCTSKTLLAWVKRDEVDSGEHNGVTSAERERLSCLVPAFGDRINPEASGFRCPLFADEFVGG